MYQVKSKNDVCNQEMHGYGSLLVLITPFIKHVLKVTIKIIFHYWKTVCKIYKLSILLLWGLVKAIQNVMFYLGIVYFKRYNTYHYTHEVIHDMYQLYILSVLDQKNLIYPQFKKKMYRLKYCLTKINDTICILQPKYQYNQYILIRYRALLLLFIGQDKSEFSQ